METSQMHAKMWVDLLTSENRARSAQHDVTRRAEVFMACGLPIDKVLDALGISRATWYRRLEALRESEVENRTASERVLNERLADAPD